MALIPYRYGYPGLNNELSLLPLDEVLTHLKNYLGNFLLDGVVTAVYWHRLADDKALQTHAQGMAALRYLSRKFLQLRPLDLNTVQINLQLAPNPELRAYEVLLRKVAPEPALMQRLDKLLEAHRLDAARGLLLDLLTAKPGMLWLADQLLQLDDLADRAEPEWLDRFQCPPPLLGLWQARLCNFYARAQQWGAAVACWSAVPEQWRTETLCNLAAEAHYRVGQQARAQELFALSLAKDPLQAPVRHRLAALQYPLVPDRGLPERRRTAIHLYSWNKAELLAETLASLARTHIGQARIQVLLNGCSDGSRELVQGFQDGALAGRLECIELPVNVGAPAARNWLAAHPASRESDYVAYLDDDVELPEDWLCALLTRLEQHPEAGVVGCKILTPGEPPTLQYLFRNLAVVRDDVFRLSLDTPNDRKDTHLYDFTRLTHNVMGCCHVFRREALAACPTFDLRYSPSQMDDIAHDFELLLHGFQVLYCGEVACLHKQKTGGTAMKGSDIIQWGNVMGNDVKFFHRYYAQRETLRTFRNDTSFLFP